MFLRDHTVKTRGKPYTYLKLVENVWTGDGYDQREIVNLGNKKDWPPERIAKFRSELTRLEAKLLGQAPDSPKDKPCWEYGETLALDAVWRHLGMEKHLAACLKGFKADFDVANAIKVMVFNRLIDPHSKLGLCSWTPRYYFPGLGMASFDVQHYYRALDYLMKIKSPLESSIRGRMKTLFNAQATLVFYDMTSSYFEGALEDSQLAAFGKSKDSRPDCKQIMLGIVVDCDGMPISHHVFPGNTHDSQTVKQMTEDLEKRFDIRHCIFVGDCGVLNPNSILDLTDNDSGRKYDYITTLRLRNNKEAEALVGQLPPREEFQKPGEGEKSEEWIYPFPAAKDPDGHPKRYLATYHPESAKAAAHAREEKLQHCSEELKHLGRPAHERKRKDDPATIRESIKSTLARKKVTRFFEWTFSDGYELHYRILDSALDYEKARDGLQIMKTDSTILSDREVVRGYRTLWRVEHTFRELKDNIDLRPNHHRTDPRIAGHVFVCVLAYLMENVIDQLLDTAGLQFSARSALEHLRGLHVVQDAVMEMPIQYVSSTDRNAKEILAALGIMKPPVHP